MPKTTQYCTFYLGNMLLGVDVCQVQEVIRQREMTTVPLAPTSLSGLMNLRGSIVSSIDLRTRFGLPAREDGVSSTNIVVQNAGGLASLLVDRIHDVIDVPQEAFEEPPETVEKDVRRFIDGVCKLKNMLLLALNVARVLDFEGVRPPAAVHTLAHDTDTEGLVHTQ